MNVKGVPHVLPYQVSTATETSEDSRQRQQQQGKKKQPEPQSEPTREESSQTASRDGEISRQIIDTGKVVELLSQRDNKNTLGLQPFRKSTTKSSQTSPTTLPKKLNRVL